MANAGPDRRVQREGPTGEELAEIPSPRPRVSRLEQDNEILRRASNLLRGKLAPREHCVANPTEAIDKAEEWIDENWACFRDTLGVILSTAGVLVSLSALPFTVGTSKVGVYVSAAGLTVSLASFAGSCD